MSSLLHSLAALLVVAVVISGCTDPVDPGPTSVTSDSAGDDSRVTSDSAVDDSTPPDPCAEEPPVCEGICALHPPVCDPVTGWECIAPGMEPDELSCDGFDNDCDGELDEGSVCPDCSFDVAAQNAALYAAWDIDFDFDCNTYFTSLVSGPDWAKVVPEDPTEPTVTYYGNENQNMGWALVDPDPENRRMVVTYSCCANCNCQAQNGLTLLYTCEASEPDCGCAAETNCPGFLDEPFLPSVIEDITATVNGNFLSSPNGLAVGPPLASSNGLAEGPRNSYYVGNFKAAQCTSTSTCTPCGPDQPGVFCTTTGENCCEEAAAGRLVNFTLPDSDGVSSWRTDAIYAGEEIIGLSTGRDGSVLVGTHLGNLYRWDPVARVSTVLQTFAGGVISMTQERPTGDWYVEVQADPKVVRLSEAGALLSLPGTVPANPDEEGVLQWGPDGQLYRLRGQVASDATLEIYPL
jgi:hypothetical protein